MPEGYCFDISSGFKSGDTGKIKIFGVNKANCTILNCLDHANMVRLDMSPR